MSKRAVPGSSRGEQKQSKKPRPQQSIQQCPFCDMILEGGDMADHFDSHEAGDVNFSMREYRNEFLTMFRYSFCDFCQSAFPTRVELQQHLYATHRDEWPDIQYGGGEERENINIVLDITSLDVATRYMADLQTPFDCFDRDESDFFKATRQNSFQIFYEYLRKWKNLKVFFQMEAKFSREKVSVDEGESSRDEEIGKFTSFGQLIFSRNTVPHTWKNMTDQFEENVESFTCEKSGWRLDQIVKFNFTLVKYSVVRGGTYIELPEILKTRSKTFLNVNNSRFDLQNSHNMCFVWSVLAHPQLGGILASQNRQHVDRLVKSYREHLNGPNPKLNLDGIHFPMTLGQIPKFEKQNPEISLTVLGYDMDEEFEDVGVRADESVEEKPRGKKMRVFQEMQARTSLLYNSKREKQIHVDLMMLMNQNNSHFVFVRNLASFLKPPNQKKKDYTCRNCLQEFSTPRTLSIHKESCLMLGLQRTTMPSGKGQYLKFCGFARTQPVPFCFYVDFEAFLPEFDKTSESERERNKMKGEALGRSIEPSKRHLTNIHRPCGFAWTCIDFNGEVRKTVHYRASRDDEDVAFKLVESIASYTQELELELKIYEDIAPSMLKQVATPDLVVAAQQSELCCLCGKTFFCQNTKVRHHSHLPPYKFEGIAHQYCNLRAKIKREFPVYFHNFSKYDAHFIAQAMGKLRSAGIYKKQEIIGRTSEVFVTISFQVPSSVGASKGCVLRLQDSISFTLKGLRKLVKVLRKDPDKNTFPITRAVFAQEIEDGGDVNLLFAKGIYPYDLMKSCKDFATDHLPPREFFYNTLKKKEIKEESYETALRVWDSFKISNMGEWHDLYVRLDTSLLADVMESLRATMQEAYGVDLAHYMSLPMMGFDMALKKSGIILELLTDSTMHAWIERSIRGAYVSVGSLRAAAANNHYMGPEFKDKETETYLIYIDANNLYGWAMCNSLPYAGFEWVSDDEIDQMSMQTISQLEEDGPEGYFFEVDLDLPEDKHDTWNDYPPAPVSRTVKYDELSVSFQQNLVDKLNVKGINKTKKLVGDLHDKKNYVVHYRVLQEYIHMGVIVSKIHKAVRFRQCKWMKPFIEFNTQKRKEAKSAFERDFWKLLNNSAFEKTIERVRMRQNCRVVTSRAEAMKFIKKPSVNYVSILNEDTCVFLMQKLSVKLNKPVYAGATVLDEAKRLMYSHHYRQMIPKYGVKKCRVVYSDTDSFFYLVETENIYKDMAANSSFDMSCYKQDNLDFGEFHSPKYEGVIGKFKDEKAGQVLTHTVAPKPKMYTTRCLSHSISEKEGEKYEEEFSQKMKGITKLAAKNQVKFNDFVRAIEKGANEKIVSIQGFRSLEHRIFTEIMEKKALNGLDTKRFGMDNVNTLAFGHKDIPIFNT